MELSPFEYVSRHKLRFATSKGIISLEDLWELPLTSDTGRPNLNDIAKDIHGELKTDDVNFVEPENAPVNTDLATMLEAVKRVIAFKQEDRKAATVAREKAARKQEIIDALAESERGALRSKTPEELRAMLAGL